MNQRRLLFTGVFLLVGAAMAFASQQAWKTPPAMQHPAEGRDNCMMCHKAGAMEAVPDAPADHAERANTTCMMCHAKDAKVQTTAPKVITHPLEGRADCLMCHKPGAMEPVPDTPADHAGRESKVCTLCHQPAA